MKQTAYFSNLAQNSSSVYSHKYKPFFNNPINLDQVRSKWIKNQKEERLPMGWFKPKACTEISSHSSMQPRNLLKTVSFRDASLRVLSLLLVLTDNSHTVLFSQQSKSREAADQLVCLVLSPLTELFHITLRLMIS